MKNTTVNGTRVLYLTESEAENGCESVQRNMPLWAEGHAIMPSRGHSKYGISDAAPDGHTAVIVEGCDTI